MKKRILNTVLCAVLALALTASMAACGSAGKESTPDTQIQPEKTEAPVEVPQQESEPTDESTGKVPVYEGVIDGECGEAVVAELKAKILKLTTENDELRKRLSNNMF